jgi:hypothetical protein
MKILTFLFVLTGLLYCLITNADNSLFPAQNTYATPQYTAQVPVADESNQERDRAIIDALKQVLITMSGNNDVANNARIQKVLAMCAMLTPTSHQN